jgi:hypothetical protein
LPGADDAEPDTDERPDISTNATPPSNQGLASLKNL